MKKRLFFLLIFITCTTLSIGQSFKATYDHSAVSVANLETSAKFYHEILKLEEIPTPGDNPKLRWFSLGDDFQLHLIIKEDDEDINLTKAVHLSLRIDDFEALLKFLDEKGIDYINWLGDSTDPSVRPDGVKQVYVQDPDGYWIELNDASYNQ